MSDQVLARKWRPKNFQQMVGQEHVLRMLTNALDNQRLHHAYLFTGTRGVGKTTLARILAKCLNCEQGISANPCGQCNICNAVDTGRFLDLIEIDAASRTKVEDTREILDNVQYAPSQGRYKIYLIDEVHMLSGHSFNALLKTLEEPPAHVKFLLATTDPKRLPITILSRCLQFNLKRVPLEQIEQHLQLICQQETLSFDDTALRLLAHAADGSMRDALSLLDQAIAFCHDQITVAQTREMLGSIEQDTLYRLLDALAVHNGQALLTEIAQLTEHTPDFNQALEDLLSILHHISITQIITNDNNTHQPASILALAKQFSAEEVQLYYQIALIGRRDLPLAPTPAQGFEMTLLRMLAFSPATSTSTSGKTEQNRQARIGPLEKTVLPNQQATTQPEKTAHSSQQATMISSEKTMHFNEHETTTSQVKNPLPVKQTISETTAKHELTDTQSWRDILPQLQLTGLAHTLATHCTLLAVNAGNIVLSLAKKHEALLNKKLQERIEQTLVNYFKKSLKLEFKITTDDIQTPAKIQQEESATRLGAAADAIKNDSTVQKMLDVFGASIDMESVKAV